MRYGSDIWRCSFRGMIRLITGNRWAISCWYKCMFLPAIFYRSNRQRRRYTAHRLSTPTDGNRCLRTNFFQSDLLLQNVLSYVSIFPFWDSSCFLLECGLMWEKHQCGHFLMCWKIFSLACSKVSLHFECFSLQRAPVKFRFGTELTGGFECAHTSLKPLRFS